MILVSISIKGFCQQSEDFKQVYYNAEYYQINNQFKEALPLYLKLLNNDVTNGNILFKTGYTYLHILGFKHKALPFLEKAIDSVSSSVKFKRETPFKETSAPLEAYLYLGEAYQANNEFEKALEKYNDYKERSDINKNNFSLANQKINSCKYAMEMLNTSSVNNYKFFEEFTGNESSYNAAISGDGNSICYNVKRKHYNAIFSSKKIMGQWESPRNITMEVESDGSYFVSSLSYNGGRLFLSHRDEDDNDIYQSEYVGERWTKATALNKNINSMHNETHAVINKSNSILYFVSDKPGGEGGLDIYESKMNQEGNWAQPESIDSIINTPFNENTPFISRDGKTLYFSSEGHHSMGGYDIQQSTLSADNKWTTPKNLGLPFNTGDDDFFFVPISSDSLGIISRCNHEPGDKKSIYLFRNFTAEADETLKKTIKGNLVFSNSKSNHSQSIDIHVTDNEGIEVDSIKLGPNQKSFYLMLPQGEYALNATGDGINSKPISIVIGNNTESEEIPIDLRVDLISPEKIHFVINSVYFETDESILDENDVFILEKILEAMKVYPELVLTVTGYTDSKGSIPYNKKLSLDRAKSVKDFLTRHHILNERVIIVGMGENIQEESEKVDISVNSKTVEKLNRRVTFSFSGPGNENITFQDKPLSKGI